MKNEYKFDFEKFLKFNTKMCPCRIDIKEDENINDLICPCKEFRTKQVCKCNLYIKI